MSQIREDIRQVHFQGIIHGTLWLKAGSKGYRSFRIVTHPSTAYLCVAIWEIDDKYALTFDAKGACQRDNGEYADVDRVVVHELGAAGAKKKKIFLVIDRYELNDPKDRREKDLHGETDPDVMEWEYCPFMGLPSHPEAWKTSLDSPWRKWNDPPPKKTSIIEIPSAGRHKDISRLYMRRGWWVNEIDKQVDVIMKCPKCKSTIFIDGHVITKRGEVGPEVRCPSIECDFHNPVKLVGWNRGHRFPMSVYSRYQEDCRKILATGGGLALL